MKTMMMKMMKCGIYTHIFSLYIFILVNDFFLYRHIYIYIRLKNISISVYGALCLRVYIYIDIYIYITLTRHEAPRCIL